MTTIQDNTNLHHWVYTDILNSDACNKIIAAYSTQDVEKLPAVCWMVGDFFKQAILCHDHNNL